MARPPTESRVPIPIPVEQIDYRGFSILSKVEGNPPVGISPVRLLVDHIHRDAGFLHWRFPNEDDVTHKRSKFYKPYKPTGTKGNTYRLTIGGYTSTGLDGKKIAASIYSKDQKEQQVPYTYSEWEITKDKSSDAYTITQPNDLTSGWTLTESGQVELRKIEDEKPIPPEQLFVFEAGRWDRR